MNEATFVAALLYEKGILTKREAKQLQDMASRETFSSELDDMINKIRKAFGVGAGKRDYNLLEINAKDLIKKPVA